MDPPSPIRRDLEQEEFLEDMINDNVDPAESPSSYLNPSGDGIETKLESKFKHHNTLQTICYYSMSF